MDINGNEAKTRPLISSMKPQKERIEERVFSDDDESERLLPSRNGGVSKGPPKIRRKVQWNDTNGGNKLAEILEFQPSEASDSDDDDSDSCFCTIM